MRIVNYNVVLRKITSDAEDLIEDAARLCYKSEGKKCPGSAKRLIRSCLNKNHVSILEHAYATFHITCDRGISHEIVRHRIANYSQESTRFCNYAKEGFGNEISTLVPSDLTPGEMFTVWCDAMEYAEKAYFRLLALGATPQTARSVLPTALKTEIMMTANFREWLHFIDLRSSKAAHPDIRPVARDIQNMLAIECPIVFTKD
jgi:thymidylate synthase (FAD)